MENIYIKEESIEDELFSIIEVKEEKFDEIDQSNDTEIAPNSFEIKKESEEEIEHSKIEKKRGKAQKTETIIKKKPFRCPECTFCCVSNIELNRHISSVHEGKKPFQCATCNKSFSAKNSMKKHISSIHEGEKFNCSLCEKSFSQQGNLKWHIASVHEGKKQFHCTF